MVACPDKAFASIMAALSVQLPNPSSHLASFGDASAMSASESTVNLTTGLGVGFAGPGVGEAGLKAATGGVAPGDGVAVAVDVKGGAKRGVGVGVDATLSTASNVLCGKGVEVAVAVGNSG